MPLPASNSDELTAFNEFLSSLSSLNPSEQKRSIMRDYENGLLSEESTVYAINYLGLEGA